jgi:hypothetical protein
MPQYIVGYGFFNKSFGFNDFMLFDSFNDFDVAINCALELNKNKYLGERNWIVREVNKLRVLKMN